jgi:hypothetical protein
VRDYKQEYEALSHALVGETGASAILTAGKIAEVIKQWNSYCDNDDNFAILQELPEDFCVALDELVATS